MPYAMDRRRFLRIGAVAGVVAATSSSEALADSLGPGVRQGRFAVGSVIHPSRDELLLSVRIKGELIEARPADFPRNWRFEKWDLVAVDLKSHNAYPYVRTSGRRNELVALNRDPGHERAFPGGAGSA